MEQNTQKMPMAKSGLIKILTNEDSRMISGKFVTIHTPQVIVDRGNGYSIIYYESHVGAVWNYKS